MRNHRYFFFAESLTQSADILQFAFMPKENGRDDKNRRKNDWGKEGEEDTRIGKGVG